MKLNKTDKLLLVTFAVVLLAAVSSLRKVAKMSKSFTPGASDTSIVRLLRPVPGGGQIFCSGIVVSDTHIITAAHCLVPTEYDVVAPTILVRTAADKPLGITAQILAFDVRSDLGILFGNFTLLNKHSVVSGAEEINQAYKKHDIAICGYPQAGRFTCSRLSEVQNYLFSFSGLGFGYPGMSGGPVFDLDTGKVIGVTSAVNGDRVILSPTIEVWKDLNVREN